MKLDLCSAALAILLAAAPVFGQINLPPHSSTYNGFSRGFNFTANTTFIISQLDLPPDAFQTGDTAGYLVRVNGVEVLRSVGNAGAIQTAILVNIGDVVDVIGNWSPAATSNFSAHNSYGAGPFNTTIQGVAHTITRCGWQWDIADSGYTGAAYLAPTTGSLGRILMWTAAPQGFATATPIGSGCGGGDPASFYELFDPANPNDLSNSQGLTSFWTGTTYVVTPGATPIVPATTGQLVLTDDSTAAVTLPWTFPTAFGGTNTVSVCSNGWVGLQATTLTNLTETVSGLLGFSVPVIACMWDDLNPAAGGAVYADVDPTNPQLFHITWDQVYEYGGSTPNTFQLSLNQSGAWELKFGALSIADGLVGYSPGGGVRDPGATDLSAFVNPVILGDDRPSISLSPVTRPVIGQTATTRTDDIPAGALAGFHIYSLAAIPGPGLDLTPVGAPGCTLYGSSDFAVPFNAGTPTAQHSLTVPNDNALAGAHMFSQSALVVAGINNLGAITTNAVDWLIDLN